MKKLLFLTICFIGLALGMKARAADFYLSPGSEEFTTGCEEAVDIMIDTEGATTDAANIYLYYDPSEIEIVDRDAFTDGVQIETGDAYQVYIDNIAEGGEVRLTGFTVLGGFSGTRTFGTVVFKGLEGAASTDFAIYYVAGDTHDSNIAEKDTAFDLLDGVTNGSYTFTSGYCVPDTTAPWVTDSSPYAGEQNYPLDGNVSFQLNDDQSGVELDSILITIQGIEYSLAGPNTFSYSGDFLDYSITVDPIADFPDGLEIDVSVYACDLDGNCRTTDWSFNEPPPPPPEDTTPPWVSDPSPHEGQENYPLDGNVTFHLEDNQDGVDIESMVATIDGVDYSLAGPYTFDYTGDSLDYFIEVDPVADFPENEAVSISVYACDISNNCDSTSWIFNEPPPPPPTCDEIYSQCEVWYEEYECEFEGFECPPGGCEPCEVEDCEAEVVYVTEPCQGEFVEIPESIAAEQYIVPVEEETIYVPEATVEPEKTVSASTVNFYVLSRRLPLSVDPRGKYYLIPEVDYTVDLAVADLPKPVSSIQWFAANARYAMTYVEDSPGHFTTTLLAPPKPAAYPAHVVITYEDGTIDRLDFMMIVTPKSSVYSVDEFGNKIPLPGVKVSLIDSKTGELWDADDYLQDNPVITDENGEYSFIVPPGNYELLFIKDGYRTVSRHLYTTQIISTADELLRKPGPIQNIGDLADWSRYLQAASRISGIELTIVLIMLILLIINLFNALLLRREFFRGIWGLYLMFRHPYAFFAANRLCGVVFNSVTKEPVPLARLRLIDSVTGKKVETAITDSFGRYKFYVETGTYHIEIDRPGYIAPSPYLLSVGKDMLFTNMNKGEDIRVDNRVDIIEPNIPIDPEVPNGTNRQIVFLFHLKHFEHAFVIVALWASLAALVVAPVLFNIVAFWMNAVIWIVVRKAKKEEWRPRVWSTVRGAITGRSVAGAVVRLFDCRYEKPLGIAITDHKGRFGILAGPGEYYLTVERDGFRQLKTNVIDLSRNTAATEIKTEIKLQPESL